MEKICLEVDNLSYTYPTLFKKGYGIENISFQISAGYITGLVGRNGVGKTTLLKRLIMGDYEHGSVKVIDDDKMLELNKHGLKLRQDMCFLDDEGFFLSDKTVLDNGKLMGELYEKFDLNKYTDWLFRFEINADKKVSDLSRGMYKKVLFAFALAYKPKILILDEPTAGLDPVFRSQFLNILADYISDGEHSVLFSTHLTEDLDKIADYIIFMGKTGNTGHIQKPVIKDEYLSKHFVIQCSEKYMSKLIEKYGRSSVVGVVRRQNFISILTENLTTKQLDSVNDDDTAIIKIPNISDIMYYREKGGMAV